MKTPRFSLFLIFFASAFGVSIATSADGENPVKVHIGEISIDRSAARHPPLDPTIRVSYEYTGSMAFGVNAEGKRLTCAPGSASTSFKIDGRVTAPAGNQPPKPLGAGPNGKNRVGIQTSWTQGDITVTQILEVIPGRPPAKKDTAPAKRRMDVVLIKFVIENKGAQSHEVGVATMIDTMCGNNDGAIFASPTTHPGRLLDGVMLIGKDVPEYLEILEIPNLQNSGFKGVFTFRIPKKIEAPDRIVLTALGATVGGWDMQAVPAMGDSAVGFFWNPREIKAKGTREVAFAYGQNVAGNLENEGTVAIDFAGNFAPNKEFTVTAYVNEPFDGQYLTLELPKGLSRTEGKDIQSVPASLDSNRSVVMWKGTVTEAGTYPVRIRSSNGVTYTRNITIVRPDGR